MERVPVLVRAIWGMVWLWEAGGLDRDGTGLALSRGITAFGWILGWLLDGIHDIINGV